MLHSYYFPDPIGPLSVLCPQEWAAVWLYVRYDKSRIETAQLIGTGSKHTVTDYLSRSVRKLKLQSMRDLRGFVLGLFLNDNDRADQPYCRSCGEGAESGASAGHWTHVGHDDSHEVKVGWRRFEAHEEMP